MDKKTFGSLTIKANAKINIGLHIIRRLPSGYHEIETILYPIESLYDVITIRELPANKKTNVITEDINIPQETNLCYKAYKLISDIKPLPPIEIKIKKRIPIGAGLGGGSSDAAATIKALNELFQLNLSIEQMHRIAEKLGADVPFFLYNKPMLAKGIGTELYPIKIPYDFKVKIVTPNIFSDTSKAYKNFKYFRRHHKSLRELIKEPISSWKYIIFNDLERVVFSYFPKLSEIKDDLYKAGAKYASMSGSGSALYALY